MTNQEIISSIDKIRKVLPEDSGKWSLVIQETFFLQVLQFVRVYIGIETEFYERLTFFKANSEARVQMSNRTYAVISVLDAIENYLNDDLEIWKTTSYKIKNDIVSDLLQQANKLIDNKEYHPAAAAILIGATLEEFLRILADKYSILIPDRSTMSIYADLLYKADVFTKQDMKDITTWAGLRNDATHGLFEEVNDRKRVKLALEGVNLFMRKYSV
jgi:hypothetical protein